MLLIPLLWMGSACTLISVGNTVKKDFAPALSRGDIPALVRHSTPELGELFSRFTQAEIQQLMRWGTTPPPSKSTGAKSSSNAKSAPPKVTGSLDDFTSTGNTARLRVKSGPVRYTFVMRRLGGRWRVHDLLIHRKAGDWSFQQILGLFLTAKDLAAGARAGKIDDRLLAPELAVALAPIVARLPAWGLLQKRDDEKDEADPDQADLLTFIDLTFRGEEAVAVFGVAGVPVELRARRGGKTWALQDVVVRVPDRPALKLGQVARALGPTLVTLGDWRHVPGKEPWEFSRVRALLGDRLEQELTPLISPLWPSAVPLLASRLRKSPAPAPVKKPAPGPSAVSPPSAAARVSLLLEALDWRTEGGDLELGLKRGGWEVRARWGSDGRLSRLIARQGELELTSRHLAGFAPFARWWDAVVTGAWGDPATWLHEGVRLLATPWSALEPLLPRRLSLLPSPLPVSRLRRLLLPGSTGAREAPSTGAADPAVSPIPPVRLERFTITADRLTLGITTTGRRFDWTWHLEQDAWRLASVRLDGALDLVPYVMLLPPAWRLLEGLTTRASETLAAALDPVAEKKLAPGLKELFATHGAWIEGLVRATAMKLAVGLAARGPRPAPADEQPAAGEKPAAPQSPTLPVLDVTARTLTFGGRALAFTLRPDGAWGLALPEPPPVKARTTLAHHALAVVELWPTLAGLYLGLATADPAALARFSSTDFTRKVWRKLGQKRLAALLSQADVALPLPTAQDLADLLLSDPARVATSGGAKAGAPALRILGTLVRADRRYPFAELWLLVDGRRIDLNFSWDATRRLFVLHEIRAQVKILGRDMTFGLRDNLDTFLQQIPK